MEGRGAGRRRGLEGANADYTTAGPKIRVGKVPPRPARAPVTPSLRTAVAVPSSSSVPPLLPNFNIPLAPLLMIRPSGPM